MADLAARRNAESMTVPAVLAGFLPIGADRSVPRIGYGTMQLPGPGVWGEPADRDAALAVLRRAVELGVMLIDTAAYYGDGVSNGLIAAALRPYPADLVVATKLGASRTADRAWHPALRPGQLRAGVQDNLRQLGLERLHLVHLRVMPDSDVPFAESLGALAAMRSEGLIAELGLSNVTAAQLAEAQARVPVATVQNFYNLEQRADAEVLADCERAGIPFLPFFPLGRPGHRGRGAADAVLGIAARIGATPAQVTLAWLLARSPVMLPIPGTGSAAHLAENVAAAALRLPDADVTTLTGLAAE